jgi:hypothetical protein
MKSAAFCALVVLAIQLVAAVDVPLNWEVPITLNNTVNVGDTVIWTWSDSAPHNVQFLTYPAGFTGISANGATGLVIPATPVRAPYTLSFSPLIPGVYTYDCEVHSSMVGTLTVRAAVTGTNTTANATLPAPVNTTAAATALNSTSNTTAIQAAVVARTLGLATAVVTLNTTSLPTFITNDFSVFAANTSGPLTISNLTTLATYLSTNLALAARNNIAANTTAPVVKQFIVISPTDALITAQVPALQHFATILWTYLNSTTFSTTPNWYAKTGVFTPAPVSLA